jgi:hypothetical protein
MKRPVSKKKNRNWKSSVILALQIIHSKMQISREKYALK